MFEKEEKLDYELTRFSLPELAKIKNFANI